MKEGESDVLKVVNTLAVGSILGKDNELFITQVFNINNGLCVPITNTQKP